MGPDLSELCTLYFAPANGVKQTPAQGVCGTAVPLACLDRLEAMYLVILAPSAAYERVFSVAWHMVIMKHTRLEDDGVDASCFPLQMTRIDVEERTLGEGDR